ncbi:hypothetical protein [Thermomonospora cellulosilytica]|uniref:Uncharacterized protein n=1 Tax=Thermomonospora cellulosilytica TaxID=1411118 RepID=A0A7W3N2G0_9ACTN|nr:hypothetical protein [Thermomonospora cellulosilytica]MBA9006311.1 hypothetical protein [Thermomonospora cellulosilytica]
MSNTLVIPTPGELDEVFQGADEQMVHAASAYLATEDYAPGDE